MSLNKIRVYVNLSIVILVLAVVVIFLLSNTQEVKVKFLGWTLWTSKSYTLIFASANLGILFFLVSKRIKLIIGQMRELKKEQKLRDKIAKEIKNESAG